MFSHGLLYFQSTKCKKLIRLSPKSKKKHTRTKESNGMDASGVDHKENNSRLPNGFTDKENYGIYILINT